MAVSDYRVQWLMLRLYACIKVQSTVLAVMVLCLYQSAEYSVGCYGPMPVSKCRVQWWMLWLYQSTEYSGGCYGCIKVHSTVIDVMAVSKCRVQW